MRAAVCTAYGPPELVVVRDVPEPAPQTGQVLVAVHAATVNRTDSATRKGEPWFARAITGWRRPNAEVLGCEYAGEVVALGRGVTGFAVGDRVFGYNEGPFGTHAQFVAVDSAGPIARTPDGVGDEVAAAATEGSHYAWAFLRRAGVAAGQEVLVNGATGAIGSAAVQLLAEEGVRVTAVCPGRHADLVRGLGAERIIDLNTSDFTDDPERFDAVFDTVGTSTFRRCAGLLRPHGVYLSSELGPYGQNLALALAAPILPGRKVRFPFPSIDAAMVRQLAEMMAAGTFRPVIDRTYPLDDIVDAYRYVESGQKVGSVVLSVPR